MPTGKLEPLVARLMGATTATLVGEGADCRFLGGSAGGGLQDTIGIEASVTLPAKKKTFRGFTSLFSKKTCQAQTHRFLPKAGLELFSKVHPLTNTNLRVLSQVRSCAVIYFLRLQKSWYFSSKTHCHSKNYF